MRVNRLVIIALSRSRGITFASASSLQTSCCALLHFFPSKYVRNIPINTGALRSFENLFIFKILILKIFVPFFWGLWGSCPYFRNSSVLPQDLSTFYLQRYPYATLKKYPRKSRKPKTFYSSLITTHASSGFGLPFVWFGNTVLTFSGTDWLRTNISLDGPLPGWLFYRTSVE